MRDSSGGQGDGGSAMTSEDKAAKAAAARKAAEEAARREAAAAAEAAEAEAAAEPATDAKPADSDTAAATADANQVAGETNSVAQQIAAGYAFEGAALELGAVVVGGEIDPAARVRIPMRT